MWCPHCELTKKNGRARTAARSFYCCTICSRAGNSQIIISTQNTRILTFWDKKYCILTFCVKTEFFFNCFVTKKMVRDAKDVMLASFLWQAFQMHNCCTTAGCTGCDRSHLCTLSIEALNKQSLTWPILLSFPLLISCIAWPALPALIYISTRLAWPRACASLIF